MFDILVFVKINLWHLKAKCNENVAHFLGLFRSEDTRLFPIVQITGLIVANITDSHSIIIRAEYTIAKSEHPKVLKILFCLDIINEVRWWQFLYELFVWLLISFFYPLIKSIHISFSQQIYDIELLYV